MSSAWAFGWGAVEAIATTLAFLIAVVTLPLIATQSRISRRAFVESFLDSITKEYLEFKNNLYELDVKRQLRDPYSWTELGNLRMASIRARLFLPSVRQVNAIGSDERGQQFSEMYLEDVSLLGELIEYASKRIEDTFERHVRSMRDYYLDALKDLGASEEEIAAYEKYDGEDQKKADDLYALVRSRYFSSQGMSADDIVRMDEAQNAECEMDAISILKHYEQDHDGPALVAYWQRELLELGADASSLKKAFVKKVGLI